MSRKKRKLLMVTHSAARSGAPILLLSLARLLKNNTDYTIHFLLQYQDVLEKEFKEIGEVTLLYSDARGAFNRFFKKIIDRFFWRIKWNKLKGSIDQFDLVLSNTMTNGNIDYLIKDHPNVLTYVHELSFSLKEFSNLHDIEAVLKHTNTFLIPSIAVKRNLEETYSIASHKFFLLPYFVPDLFVNKTVFRKDKRTKLGLKEDAFIIGGMGVPGWRKGTDIFMLIAKKLKENNQQATFIWCGGKPESLDWLALRIDLDNLGLKNVVLTIPTQADPLEYMSVFDIFLLTSREDPYPVVVLEAAMMEIPTICFDRSGGAIEFVENDAGYILPYLDIQQASEKISLLNSDKHTLAMLGQAARKKYLERHSEKVVLNAFSKLEQKQNSRV